MSEPLEKNRVAIIGGGCASIAAAFELTRPEHQGLYEVTVYQLGWRLGGKGASGRGAAGRIEEHGLHLWMGCYDNAFRLMREAYAELNRDPERCAIATWEDAFEPDPYVGLADANDDGTWRRLMAHFPAVDGLPGDPLPNGLPMTVSGYLSQTIRLLGSLLASAQSVDGIEAAIARARNEVDGNGEQSVGHQDRTTNGDGPSNVPLADQVQRLLKYGRLLSLTAVIQAVATLEMVIAMIPIFPKDLLNRLLDTISDSAHEQLQPLLDGDRESQYLWEIIDVILAQIRGIIRFNLLSDPRGFDAVNDYDSREWLMLNGASQRAVNSAFMRGLYDLIFAFEGGDLNQSGMAAGQGLRGGMRMFFGYRGALFWKMQAGMGDIVFSPFYEVLKKRGVRFEFFHRLQNVGIAEDTEGAPYVSTLGFDVQAHLKSAAEYQPLTEIGGLPCWPSEPLWDQLENGTGLKAEGRDFELFWDSRRASEKTLSVGKDFDFVVLGLSIGAVPYTCREILTRDSRWRSMVANVKTVATQAFQVWLKDDMRSFGWEEDAPNLSGFVEPFDTWADMTHLVSAEQWQEVPGSIAYFCNVLPESGTLDEQLADPEYPARMREVVKQNAIRFLNNDIEKLWPRALRPDGQFRWESLMDAQEQAKTATGEETVDQFDSQFWTANVNPSDRYVLSLPGTLQYRISPLDNTYNNLTIAGDWTDCGMNFGCVEAAVMSGMLAAHALSQSPRLEEIVAYDHP